MRAVDQLTKVLLGVVVAVAVGVRVLFVEFFAAIVGSEVTVHVATISGRDH